MKQKVVALRLGEKETGDGDKAGNQAGLWVVSGRVFDGTHCSDPLPNSVSCLDPTIKTGI